MDRRATLALLLGQKKATRKVAKKSAKTTAVLNGLIPYTGPWGFEQAAHLMRRTTMGPNYALIKGAENLGLDATVANLLADYPLPDPPLNPSFQNDIDVPVGRPGLRRPIPDRQLP
ncbi:MAG: hypothetical protein IPJ40_09975 [Saprospirales bacterium]|nr:hypothetical protein [Saprospirales bacterium]